MRGLGACGMRRERLLSVWTVASTILVAFGVATAQHAERAKPLSPTAVQKAAEEIDKAALARNIKLTDAAKQALIKEALHEESTTPSHDGGPVTGALSEDQLSKLLTPLADAPPDKQLDVRDVQTRVIDNKSKQVVAQLPDDIRAHERTSGKRVPGDVRLKMMDDLTKQSGELSKSGLPVDAIRQRNEATLKAIDLAVGSDPITTRSYQIASAEIFTRNVRLSILSTPDGAIVKAAGFQIGKTNITDKPFQPGAYMFTFHLDGYGDAERHFYVTPGLESDSFTQALIPRAGSNPAPGRSPESTPGSETDPNRKRRFPFAYTILGAIIVVLLVALVARRR